MSKDYYKKLYEQLRKETEAEYQAKVWRLYNDYDNRIPFTEISGVKYVRLDDYCRMEQEYLDIRANKHYFKKLPEQLYKLLKRCIN